MQATLPLKGNGLSALRPGRFTPGKCLVIIVNETVWISRLVWAKKEKLASPGFDPRTVRPAATIPTRLSRSSRSPEETEGRRN